MMIGFAMDSIARLKGMKEISELEMIEAIKFAHEAIKVQIAARRDSGCSGKKQVRTYEEERKDEDSC